MEQLNGLVILNKPKGLSSAQCGSRLKRLGQKKIGHAGTLDPMATGVLPLLLGHATKISGFLLEEGRKTYLGTVRFGMETDTWDAEGVPVRESIPPRMSEEDLKRAIASWIGETEQIVPPYSAAKHHGKTLYQLSRAGLEVPLKTKRITVYDAEIVRVDFPCVTFRITCGSGTYIRSLAHSLGICFGCGAVLTSLTREYSHPFGLDRAVPLEKILECPEMLPQIVIPVTEALNWPLITVTAEEAQDIRNGRPLIRHQNANETERHAVAVDSEGTPIALMERNEYGIPHVLRGLWTTP
ncbi:MAG: tRNA pseudouridine(55) synthase TruB [Desulfovibrionaceae bacterium]|nr:tRNA pseudouridine(55) synthase TruB [Desulfovibrionaceae bacterium]